MSSPDETSRVAIRCADSDRELVANLLNAAFAQGRITTDEHSERLDATWQARTFGELEAVTADLTHAPLPEVTPATTAQRTLVDPSNAAALPDRIHTVMGTARREGAWRLRRHTLLKVLMGEAKLDLRRATLDDQICVIDLHVVMGEVIITLPDGVLVRDETRTVMGETKLRGLVETPLGAPTVVLRGRVVMGELTVNGPGHTSLGQRLGIAR